MRRLRLLSTALAVGALSLGVAACGDDEDDGGSSGGGGEDVSDASFDLNVGVLVPQTGDLSAFGPAGEKAANIAVEQTAAALEEAGADGITIEASVEDSQTEPAAAQSAATKLISGGSSCLIGPWSSGETVPVGRSVAARETTPLISPSATSPEITELPDDGYVFRTAPSDALQGQVIAEAMEAEFGTDAVVSVAARNDAYGEGIATEFTAAWEAAGGSVTDGSPVLYDVELSSYNSEAESIVADSPDAYVIIDFEEPYNEIGAALARTGDFDASTMFTADGLAFEDGIPDSIAPDSLYSANGTRPATPESDISTEFDSLFSDAEPADVKRNSFDSQNFDAVTLCALAAVAAGSNEGPAIAEQIQAVASAPGDKYDFTTMADAITALQAGEDIDFEGVSGNLDLDDNGDPTVGTYDIYAYDDKGAFSVEDQVQKESGE
jgi:ABC-type branched-subunit amino acid transport system substrate-binding protein